MFDWVLNTPLLGHIIALNLQLIFFISRKNNFCTQDVSFFVFLLNPQTSKSETPLLTLQIRS